MDVIALIEAKGLTWVQKADDEIGITCPNALNHQGGYDAKPSFNVNTNGKGGHCFACGFSLSAEYLLKWLMGDDLDEMTFKIMQVQAKLNKLKTQDEEPMPETFEVFLPPGEPWDEDGFRGISLETYQRLGALKVNRGRYEGRIAFPIYVNGELKGIDARALHGQEPKYLRNRNSTCSHDWLYPYDIVKEMVRAMPVGERYVLLGEGIFHGINPVDKGVPALSYFGANNFSLNKVSMIVNLGVDEVIYVKDPDKAGVKAEQVVCSMLKDWVTVTTADIRHLPEGKDLGDLSDAGIAKAIHGRHRPLLPTCLPEQTKVEFGVSCRLKCPFNVRGKCSNVVWMKETR